MDGDASAEQALAELVLLAARAFDVDPWVMVRAAGGIVEQAGPAGGLAIVHRPAYDDWAFPKGKLEPGESLAQAALREVEEETGLVCRILRPLACLAYPDGHGREKAVCYWLMEPVEGEFRAGKEVDAVRWATGTEALGLLTYRGDQILLRAFLSKFATR